MVKALKTYHVLIDFAFLVVGGSLAAFAFWLGGLRWLGLVIAITLLLVLVYEGLFQLQRAEYERVANLRDQIAELEREPFPVIEFGPPRQARVPMHTVTYGGNNVYQRVSTASFAFATVKNTQAFAGKGLTAAHVRLELRFDTADGKHLLGPIQGKWRDTEQSLERGGARVKQSEHFLNIPANGQLNELDLAFKLVDDAQVFAYNQESESHDDGRSPELLIHSDRFVVTVDVCGENFALVQGRYLITHDGEGSDLVVSSFEELSESETSESRPQ